MSQCLGGLQRPVINEGCSSFFLLVSFLFSFFVFFSHSIQLHAQFKTTFHYDPYIHPLMLCDDWGNGWPDFYVELLTKNNVRINELYFSKRPLLRFRSKENCCMLINLIVTTTPSTPSSNSLVSPEHPTGFLFPEEYKLINSTVAASWCHLTLLPLQNTGFRFSFPRTLLADRRSFFLSLTWARISSSLLVSLLVYRENKKCNECNRVVYFNAWCRVISNLKRKNVVGCSWKTIILSN